MDACSREPDFLHDSRFLPWVVRNGFHHAEIDARTRFDWRQMRARSWALCHDRAQDGSAIRSWEQWIDLPGPRRALFRDTAALATTIFRGIAAAGRPILIALPVLLLIIGFA